MMNTREKKEGLDGIKLWNICYPMIKDFDQTSAVVKELTELKLIDPAKIIQLVQKWNECSRRLGGVIEDVLVTWRLEITRFDNLDNRASLASIKRLNSG